MLSGRRKTLATTTARIPTILRTTILSDPTKKKDDATTNSGPLATRHSLSASFNHAGRRINCNVAEGNATQGARVVVLSVQNNDMARNMRKFLDSAEVALSRRAVTRTREARTNGATGPPTMAATSDGQTSNRSGTEFWSPKSLRQKLAAARPIITPCMASMIPATTSGSGV